MEFFDLTLAGAPAATWVLELPAARELWAGLVGMLAMSGVAIVAAALRAQRMDRDSVGAGVPELLGLVAPRARA